MNDTFVSKKGMSFVIRRLMPDDWKEALDYIRAFSKECIYTNQYPGQPEKTREELCKNYSDENRIFFGVFYENRIVGIANIVIIRPNHPWVRAASFGIGMLKDFYHQGIGTELMQRIIAWGKERHMHRIEGVVRTKNLPAINLYLKCGFVIEGQKREWAFINGEWHDEYVIGLILDD